MDIKKVCLYLRKSRNDTDLPLDIILSRHERQLKDFCTRCDLIIVKTYKEIVSADTIEKRPQMQALLNDVLDGLYYAVVVMDLDRLSRGNQIDQLEILETFKSANTLIITPTKTYDLKQNDYDEDFFDFALFMSRREYKLIKRRLLRGRKQAQKDGYFVGSRCPFGYSKEKRGRGFVLVENEHSKYVVDIFKMHANGVKLQDICNYLNNLNIPTISGGLFTPQTVKRIIRNKDYIGYITVNSDKTAYKGLHKPLIDKTTFDKANARLSARSCRCNHGKTLINPLASLLRCGVCGRVMHLQVSRGKKYYTCTLPSCATKNAKFEDVENQLLKELRTALNDFNYVLKADKMNDKEILRKKEIKAIEKAIEKNKEKINKICDAFETGIYTKERYFDRLNAVENDTIALNGRLKELNEQTSDSANATALIPKLSLVLKEYERMDAPNKNKLLKALIDKIEYHNKKGNGAAFTLIIHLKI